MLLTRPISRHSTREGDAPRRNGRFCGARVAPGVDGRKPASSVVGISYSPASVAPLFGRQAVRAPRGSFEGLIEVFDDVAHVLDADTEADHLRLYARLCPFLGRHLAMRGRGR